MHLSLHFLYPGSGRLLGDFVWEDFSGEAATGDEAGSSLVDLKCRTKI